MAFSLSPRGTPEAYLIGFNVRNLRKIQKLTQKDVAARAKVSQAEICRVEKGLRNLSARRMNQLALALQVPLSWLLNSEDDWKSSEHRVFRPQSSVKTLEQLKGKKVKTVHEHTRCVYASMWLLHEMNRRENGTEQ